MTFTVCLPRGCRRTRPPGRPNVGPHHTRSCAFASDFRRHRQPFDPWLKDVPGCPRPGGRRHADRRPFLLAAGASRRRCGAGSRRLRRGRDRRAAGLARQRDAPARLRDRADRPGGRARRSICTPRRSSPARSCWPRASERIFEFARVFRNRERGALHHPEFTMLEWYRADEPYEALMEDCAACWRLRPRRPGRSASRSAAARPIRSPSRSG